MCCRAAGHCKDNGLCDPDGNARARASQWQASGSVGGSCTHIKAIGKVAGQGAHPGWPSQRKARSLFASCCCYTLQSRHEGEIRTTGIDREMQEAGDHSRHAKVDCHGQRITARSTEMGRISSLTNTDTRQIAMQSPAGQWAGSHRALRTGEPPHSASQRASPFF